MKRDLLEKKNPLLAFQLRQQEFKKGEYVNLSYPKDHVVACYITEIGTEKWQEEMIAWLEQNQKRHLYFLPKRVEDLLLIDIKLLDMPQFQILNSPEMGVWEHLFMPWEWLGDGKKKQEMEKALSQAELVVSLYRDSGVLFLKNLLKNASSKSLDGTKLKGWFKNIPAVICGAGISLDKNFQTLKTLEDEALVFGGGSALQPLSKEGISVDFIASLDPEPPIERFYRQTYFETPLFYQRQVDPNILRIHQGAKLTFGRSGNFPIEEWLLEDQIIDVGWTVTTFMTAIAYHLGCNPIYLVGVDFCHVGKERYAQGVEGEDDREDLIEAVDRHGKKVMTRPDFLAAKEWFENFAIEHPEITFVNLSNGLELEGIPFGGYERNFKRDIKGKIASAVQMPLNEELRLPKIQESIKKTHLLLNEALKTLSEGKNPILYDVELDEEPFYQLHLLACWDVWKHLLQKEDVISTMKNPEVEKKLQQLLFFQEITERFINERDLCI